MKKSFFLIILSSSSFTEIDVYFMILGVLAFVALFFLFLSFNSSKPCIQCSEKTDNTDADGHPFCSDCELKKVDQVLKDAEPDMNCPKDGTPMSKEIYYFDGGTCEEDRFVVHACLKCQTVCLNSQQFTTFIELLDVEKEDGNYGYN